MRYCSCSTSAILSFSRASLKAFSLLCFDTVNRLDVCTSILWKCSNILVTLQGRSQPDHNQPACSSSSFTEYRHAKASNCWTRTSTELKSTCKDPAARQTEKNTCINLYLSHSPCIVQLDVAGETSPCGLESMIRFFGGESHHIPVRACRYEPFTVQGILWQDPDASYLSCMSYNYSGAIRWQAHRGWQWACYVHAALQNTVWRQLSMS
jgi:hypothetical protein